MVQACRHIKPSGLRCKSPAMREHLFCYFHARVHTRTGRNNPERTFPVPEDFAAIQESIARLFDGIVNESIGPKQSSQILRGLQIALQTISRASPLRQPTRSRKSRSPKRATNSLRRSSSLSRRSKTEAAKTSAL